MSAKEYFEKQYRAAVERQRLYESRGLIEPGDSWIGLDMKLFLDTNAPTPQTTPSSVATPPPADKPPSPFRRFFMTAEQSKAAKQSKQSKSKTDVRIEMKPPSPRLKALSSQKDGSF